MIWILLYPPSHKFSSSDEAASKVQFMLTPHIPCAVTEHSTYWLKAPQPQIQSIENLDIEVHVNKEIL